MHESITPEAWRKMTITEISKKGDEEKADNHCPICTISALCEGFSTLLCGRLCSKLDRRQPPDQGEGFRRSFQTLDHPATQRLVEPNSREWCVKRWVATVVFAKAFDTIRHDALWKAFARLNSARHTSAS